LKFSAKNAAFAKRGRRLLQAFGAIFVHFDDFGEEKMIHVSVKWCYFYFFDKTTAVRRPRQTQSSQTFKF